MKILVLALGNPNIEGDNIGIKTLQRLREVLKEREDAKNIVLREAYIPYLHLIFEMENYEKIIIVDAMEGLAPQKMVERLNPNSLLSCTTPATSTHTLNLSLFLNVIKLIKPELISRTSILGVNVAHIKEGSMNEIINEVMKNLTKNV